MFMRNGLLIYRSYKGQFNIGDYVQSLAASQFISNKVDYYINREELDEFKENEVKLIMNGWFTSEPRHWPPSSMIHPLFVSFHINSLSKEHILSKEGIIYLKQHEPIGCRDWYTTKMLNEKNVDAYFSGCLTLTLGEKYASNKKGESIYFVDAFSSSNKNLPTILIMLYLAIAKSSIIRKIAKKNFSTLSITSFRKAISFYREYSKHFSDDLLGDAEYIKHIVNENLFRTEQEKFDYAQELLKKYAQAKLVITSRIHCALPCLAVETPVIFVDNAQQEESSYCRLNGLRELFNLVSSDKGELKFHFEKEPGKINRLSKLKNRRDFEIIRDKLINMCNTFMKD